MIFKSARRYGDTLNSYDVLKLLALAAMVVDHLGNFIYHDNEYLRAVGRYAFPTFLFLVGYSASWKIKPNIIICTAVVMLCAALTHHRIFPVNILGSIIAARMLMARVDEDDLLSMHTVSVFLVSVIFFVFSIFFVEYGTLNILFAYCGLLRRRHPQAHATYWFIGTTVVFQAIIQNASFDFHLPAALVMVAMLTLMFYQFIHFTVHTVNDAWMPTWLKTALQWFSHNALLFYALHVGVLMVVEAHLYPTDFKKFRWF